MAVVSVKPIIGRDGDSTGESGTLQITFRIEVSSPSDSAITIAPSLPTYLSPHPENIFFTCRRVSLREVANAWKYWEAVAYYSSEPLTQREKELQTADPTARPPKIRWQSRDETVPSFADRRGIAKVNSAGDYYDPPPDVIEANWTITVETNQEFIPVAILDYQNAVNDDSFTIDGVTVPQGAARIAGISIGEEIEENGSTYRVFSYTLETRRPHPSYVGTVIDQETGGLVTPEPWDDVRLDQGLRERVPGTGTGSGNTSIRQISDSEGNIVNSPVLLDGSGSPLEDAGPDNAVFHRYRDHDRLDFSGLPGVV